MINAKELSAPPPGHNRQWILRSVLEAGASFDVNCFELAETTVPTIGHNQVLLRTLYLGTSPAQRAYITASDSMHQKVRLGEVMRGRGLAQVVQSNSQQFSMGDVVVAATGWQDFSVQEVGEPGMFAMRKLGHVTRPYSLSLGILGNAGYTAYFGLTDVGQIKSGDTVLVSAAAGGVGSCAVQIAKAMGCKVIGIAGGPDKCTWLRDELNVELTIDYKSQNIDEALQQLCPSGVDLFFDNVGGEQLQTALAHLAIGARVVICGYISTDYQTGKSVGPSNYTHLLSQRARMQGFFVFDYWSRFAEAEASLCDLYQQGSLLDNSDILAGMEMMPRALASLFNGSNCGVRMCQVSAEAE